MIWEEISPTKNIQKAPDIAWQIQLSSPSQISPAKATKKVLELGLGVWPSVETQDSGSDISCPESGFNSWLQTRKPTSCTGSSGDRSEAPATHTGNPDGLPGS